MLLPQSEVQAPKQLPEAKPKTKTQTTQSARKRSREYIKEEEEKHCRVDCFDSDSCASSDDTIDEFISSEDLSEANRRTFSRVNDKSSGSLSSKVLGLPSMLSTRYTSAIGRPNKSLAAKIGEELKRVSESRSSSGSITVGSLEQTSLELSDDSNSEETATVTTCISKSGTTNAGSGTAIVTTNKSGTTNAGSGTAIVTTNKSGTTNAGSGTAIVTTNKSGTTTASVRGDNSQARQGKELIDRDGCVDKIEKDNSNEQGLTLLQPSLDLSLDDCSPFKLERRNDRARGNDRKIKDGRGGRKEKELLPAVCEEEWHLTLECSSEEEKKMDTSSECTNYQKYLTMVDEPHDTKPLTPKSGDSAVLPPAKRKKRSRERKRHHHRERTDLSTPVEGEMVATTTPRKLFHERELKKDSVKKDRKKHRKSKSEAEKNKVKETKIIDLTQDDDDEELNQTAVVTGINDVINKEQKGKSPTQKRPPTQTSNSDHHSDETSNNNNRMEQAISSSSNFIPEPILEIDHELEVDSDITFCEECSENTTDTLGSPFYLPPTPGRENVSSILKRKSIAFSD